MSVRLAFLGDELSAAGYRLAGATVRAPAEGQELAALEAARVSADLVLMSARLAARLPPAALAAALTAVQPLAMVVPELDGGGPPADAGENVRRLLGGVA